MHLGGVSTSDPSALTRTFNGIDATLEVMMLRARAQVGTDINSARDAVMPVIP
jgi:hypothetical protein